MHVNSSVLKKCQHSFEFGEIAVRMCVCLEIFHYLLQNNISVWFLSSLSHLVSLSLSLYSYRRIFVAIEQNELGNKQEQRVMFIENELFGLD